MALDIIESLEKKLGKPVVTSNSASMWKMMRLAGDKRAVPGGGAAVSRALDSFELNINAEAQRSQRIAEEIRGRAKALTQRALSNA